ncbi:class I SAM-dependent methyltransferase [Nonomuraea sp. SBT364]|uniref:class I SAM-dependent methyltransferase n=1 Tax=Nonomuraea sp. SBT364 TaxID=1580530 RepID=UPI00066C5270|nr:class I SAM-dependent methyltransferase [Nonomuraea sp. SBT364]
MANHHEHANDSMTELLDLDAEVLRSHLSDVTGWVGELTAGRPPRRILDLGSGTGTGSFALLERFPGAEAVALDVSEQMLHRVRDEARERGLADQISTVQADLDTDPETAWPRIGAVDLVWASASLHHLADPHRVLTEVHAALRPGGLLVAVEMDGFPRFLPGEHSALEERCHALLDRRRAAALPHFGDDWAPRLAKAGFTVEAERVFDIHLTSPLPAPAGRYAELSLGRMRHGLAEQLDAGDLAALDSLLEGVARRHDLTVRTTRTVWAARR